jgi:hypothetical protein
LVLIVALALVPRPAAAWWEATLQQVDVTVRLAPSGVARVAYDLRYHVDRGRFQGVTIRPGASAPMRWIRPESYIENAIGQRYGLTMSVRRRDDAQIIRLRRRTGLPRGWVTVHLVYEQELQDCCIHQDEQGRPRLEWSAFSWEVGMDRLAVDFHLDPPAEVTPDEATAQAFRVRRTDEALRVEKIRPVRWYEMRVGLVLPQGWLEAAPPEAPPKIDPAQGPDLAPADPLPSGAAAADSPLSSVPAPALALFALGFWLLLLFKYWLTADGYPGRPIPPRLVLVPHVPATLRWTTVAVALAAGLWLQITTSVAAGTLAFAAGVLLTLRGRAPLPTQLNYTCWKDVSAEAGPPRPRPGRGRVRLAPWFDATSLPGALVAVAMVTALIELGRATDWTAEDSTSLALGLDLALTLGALLLTGRRRDSIPTVWPASWTWKQLRSAQQQLVATLAQDGCNVVCQEGATADGAPAETLRLICQPPPTGTQEVTLTVEPRLSLHGWKLTVIGQLRTDGGELHRWQGRPTKIVKHMAKLAPGPAPAGPDDASKTPPAPPTP